MDMETKETPTSERMITWAEHEAVCREREAAARLDAIREAFDAAIREVPPGQLGTNIVKAITQRWLAMEEEAQAREVAGKQQTEGEAHGED